MTQTTGSPANPGLFSSCIAEDKTVSNIFAREKWLAVVLMVVSYGASAADMDWPVYGGTHWNQRHVQFKAITKETVGNLVPRRVLQLGQTQKSMSASPLVIDGVMYVSGSDALVQAFDLRTSQRKWSYQHKIDNTKYPANDTITHPHGPACCSNTSRGVAYADGMVYFAAIDASVIALNAETGKEVWRVLGVKDKDNPGGIYGYNSAPVAIGDMIVIGSTGGESPTRHHLTAFDQKTGKQVWRWYSIPAPDGSDPVAPDGWWGDFNDTTRYGQKLAYRDIAAEKAAKSTFPDTWKVGGVPLWMPVTYDEQLDLIFVGTGNPNPDMDGRGRPGDNLYSNSIVAIDAKTGQTRWYFQVTPHGLWDRDEVSPPVVAMVDGRKVVVHAGKGNLMLVMDAASGEFIQVSEALSPEFNKWTAPTSTPIKIAPGGSGGNQWSPISVDESRNLGFVAALFLPTTYTIEAELEVPPFGRGTASTLLGGNWTFAMDEIGGYLSAVDLTTGKIKWQHQSPTAYVGGILSISTGVLFLGEPDGNLTAFDSDTGEMLWRFNTGAGVIAPPIAFVLDGEEYIAVSSGGSGSWSPGLMGDDVFVFGLPRAWSASK